jgi:hypothetical protein
MADMSLKFRDDPEVSWSDLQNAYEEVGLAKKDAEDKKAIEDLEWELQKLEHEWHMSSKK